jgi:hypothetical protein
VSRPQEEDAIVVTLDPDHKYQSQLMWQRECGISESLAVVVLDSDLQQAFHNCVARPSAAIVEVLATIDGANDGPDWHWLALLANGYFAYITGGCDYTGWG